MLNQSIVKIGRQSVLDILDVFENQSISLFYLFKIHGILRSSYHTKNKAPFQDI